MSQIKNLINLLKCIWCVGWRSVAVMLADKASCAKKFDLHTREGSRRLLEIVKANCQVNRENLPSLQPLTPYIFMCNHQSLFDLPLIFSAISVPMRVLVKRELISIPLFGKAVIESKNIAIDRENPETATDIFASAKQILNNGMALLVFPEGTRSKDGKILPFKAGSFRLARETQAKIIPIGIQGTRNILPAGHCQLSLHQTLKINIGKPIDTKDFTSFESQKSLMNLVHQEICRLTEVPNEV